MKKKLLLTPLLALPFIVPSHSTEYNYKILRVIDGDTVVIEAPYLPDPLKKEISLRITGIDTPEKDFRAKCDQENELGHNATAYTESLINNAKSYTIDIQGEDKYFRLLGDIIIDGERISQKLIKKHYAREYDGGKKESWCNIN